MKKYFLYAFLAACFSKETVPSYDIITVVTKEENLGRNLVIKYIDQDKDGKVDYYGWGYGERTGDDFNPYSIEQEQHFYVRWEYAQAKNIQINATLNSMTGPLDSKVQREYEELRAFDPKTNPKQK